MRKNILILSSTASAINCILSLRDEPDLQLFVTDNNRYAGGLYSEGIVPIVVPRARDLTRYKEALEGIIAGRTIDVIIPTSDRDAEGVVTLLHHGWDPKVAVFRPPYEAFRILSNKQNLSGFLEDRLPEILPTRYKVGEDPIFPAVVKPVDEGGTKGVSIVRDAVQHASAVTRLQRIYGSDYIVQEYIPGGIGSIHMVLMLYDKGGELLHGVTMQSHLTFMTWGGGGNAGAIVEEPEPLELAKTIVEAAGGWSGPICVEFKRHSESGRFYLLEANCRLNGYSYLTTMNGFNYPKAIVELLLQNSTSQFAGSPSSTKSNFLLGFREQPVREWVTVDC